MELPRCAFQLLKREVIVRLVLTRFTGKTERRIVFCALGDLNEYRGRLEETERWYQRGVDNDPDDAGCFIFLGAIQARLGRLRDAEATHRAATQCQSGCIDEAYHNLGLVLRGQGRFAEAADCFRKAIELDPDYAYAVEALADVETALALVASDTAWDRDRTDGER